MKRLIFVLLCFSILTLGSSAKIIEVAPAGAWGVIGISGGGSVVEEGTVLEFEELFDFTANVEDDVNWDVTTSTGTVTLLKASGTYAYVFEGEDFAYWHAIYQTAAGGVDQAVKMRMGEASIDTGFYMGYGALLRAVNAGATGICYRLYVKGNNTGVVKFAVETNTGVSTTDYGSDVTIDAVTDGDWIGFAVTGTGASTVFSYWDFGVTDPGDYGSWGDATETLDETGLDTPLDAGNYVGFFLGYHVNGPHHQINTWEGGGW